MWLITQTSVIISVSIRLTWWRYIKNMNLPMPTPTTIRPTSRTSFTFARPIITEPAVNTRLPSRMTGLRPTLSETYITAYSISCLLLLSSTPHVVRSLNLRRLMSYIYIYIYIYMEHPFLMFLDHTQRRSTVGRTPLDE